MDFLSSGLILLLLVLAGLNLSWGRRFARLFRESAPEISRDELPPVAVILSLRGDDPFLPDCLSGLAEQDYPDYRVTLVIDHEHDPCAAVVNEFLERRPDAPFEITYLNDPLKTCSLKVSALMQAINQLDARYEFVASLDADVVASPQWLREMVTPLVADSTFAASTGIRWYVPQERTLPNLIRRQWNIGAVIQMYLFDIPWGGSLAIRRSFISESDLFQQWSQSLCEDTPLAAAIMRHRRAIRFIPEAVMINRESITLPGVFRFIGRQLLFTQLYHPRWFAVQLPGILNGILPLVSLAVCGVSIATGNLLGWGLGAAIVAHGVSLILQIKIASSAVRTFLRRRGVELQRSPLNGLTLIASECSVLTQLWGVLRPFFIRTIDWRGITYRRTRGKQFELVNYVPFESQTTDKTRREYSI